MQLQKKQKHFKVQPKSGSLSKADFISKLIAVYNTETTYSANKFTGSIGDIYQDIEHNDVLVKIKDIVIDSDETIFIKLECIGSFTFRYVSEAFPNFTFRDLTLEKQKNDDLKASSMHEGKLRVGAIIYVPANYFDIYFKKVYPDKWDDLNKILNGNEKHD